MCDDDDYDDYDEDPKVKNLLEYLAKAERPTIDSSDLDKGLYSLSELNCLECESMSHEDAFKAWELIERLRRDVYPDELRM